jgi:dipeptidyl aminopeptidase/acylaminoacyl peptidase
MSFPYASTALRRCAAAPARLAALLCVVLPTLLSGQATLPGRVLSERACQPPRGADTVMLAWNDDSSGFRDWLTRERYDALIARWECRRIEYDSDGVRVVGFIYRPRDAQARHPAIIVNRGGTGDFGKMHDRLQPYYLPYLEAGYVILMSQYRGADGGEGRDEYGGADTVDVANLVHLARRLPYVDPEALFMLGYSRGGMMTYQALAMGLPIRAAATVSGLTDLEDQVRYRLEMRDSVYALLWPDFAMQEAAHYRMRSAVAWAERIKTPLLLVHGTADDRVRATDAMRLAAALQAHGRAYELHIFDGDGHGVPRHKWETDQRILAWFARHHPPRAPRELPR